MMSVEKRVQRLTSLPLFPFTAAMEVKELSPPMEAELLRAGEGDKPCHSCDQPDRIIWSNDRWKITEIEHSANPVGLFLETVAHMDFDHFDETYARELGVLTWRLEEGIRRVDSVGRVHIHRWGDGSAHFHMWFQGRPAKQLELYGWGNVLWPQILDPLPGDVIAANHAQVVEHLNATLA
jgi:hypothetical protein